jgi:hypothetical protein
MIFQELNRLNFICFSNHHKHALRTWHSATHQQQMIFGINANHLEISHGNADATESAGHLLTFEDATRIGAAACTTEVTMALLHAVRSTLTGEVMTLHNARKATALAGGNNIHRFCFCEDRGI